MNNRIISVVSDPNVGGTFLSWTLHYLNGHNEYFHYESNSYQPLADFNSHGFAPNQPTSINYSQAFISALSNADTEDFHVLYFQNFKRSNLLEQIDENDFTTFSKTKLVELLPRSYKAIIDASSDYIVLTANENHNLYFSNKEFQNDLLKHLNEEQFLNYSNLTDIWDRREFLAFNIKLNQVTKILKDIKLTNPHFLLDTYDLYNSFDKTVIQLFDYLRLTIDQSRKDNWHNVYEQWQLLHYDRIRFNWYFNQIIDSIINNHYMDLTRFNLNLIQEACIQQRLIYDHKLNLKGWQLEKFSNTKQLHNLLEPMI